MKKIINRFLTVKTIITLAILFVFVYMVICKELPTEFVTAIISTVLTYYFTKPDNKDGDNIGNNNV